MAQYTHTTDKHNLRDPEEIVPVIIKMINPKSVIDVGCGLGTFLKVFKNNGVNEILGIDGPWCNKQLLFKNINEDEFIETDMEKKIHIDKKYDLAVCLEVAEHLSPERSDSFVQDLTNMADMILFSAAIPKQGGDHHYNEQWLTYWQSKFEANGFEVHDILKPIFWNNQNIFWWYRQNMVLIVKKGLNIESIKNLEKNPLSNAIHPDLFLTITDYKDKNAIKRYLRSLYKAVLYKVGLTK